MKSQFTKVLIESKHDAVVIGSHIQKNVVVRSRVTGLYPNYIMPLFPKGVNGITWDVLVREKPHHASGSAASGYTRSDLSVSLA